MACRRATAELHLSAAANEVPAGARKVATRNARLRSTRSRPTLRDGGEFARVTYLFPGDRAIPTLQRYMAKRIGARTIEVKASLRFADIAA